MSTPRPRPAIEALEAYVPGEQPKVPGLIKLNTNENPYPPPPDVLEAVRACANDRLSVYPDPNSSDLCAETARQNGLAPSQVLFVNGSDEILRMICMAYLDPGEQAAMLWPTYSLYDTLIAMFAGRFCHIPAGAAEPLPLEKILASLPLPVHVTVEANKEIIYSNRSSGPAAPRVFFLASPNPPFGTYYPNDQIEALGRALPDTLLVVDEAYADFAEGNAVALLARLPNLIITRTYSKSFSLAGMRLGWAMASEEIIAILKKVKDSYNLDRVAQAVGLASMKAAGARREAAEKVKNERRRVTRELRLLGFDVPESSANFIFPRRGPLDAETWFVELRRRNILARKFKTPELSDGLRISIGTPEQMDRVLEATREIIAAQKAPNPR